MSYPMVFEKSSSFCDFLAKGQDKNLALDARADGTVLVREGNPVVETWRGSRLRPTACFSSHSDVCGFPSYLECTTGMDRFLKVQ